MDHLTSISNFNWLNVITTSSSSFLLIFAAEVGDKSQLVCMALAARYRAAPVMLGSILAFLLLVVGHFPTHSTNARVSGQLHLDPSC